MKHAKELWQQAKELGNGLPWANGSKQTVDCVELKAGG